jgi:hypothetical protein
MSSLILFGNVRMSGMGKNLITSYAALGVGLAVVLTFGLTAISSVMEPVQQQFTVSDQDNAMMAQIGSEEAAERKALEALPAESPESAPVPPAATEAQEDVGGQTSEPSGMGGETATPMMDVPAQEESSRESYLIATDVPSASSSFAGILMALPYIAAAAVGSAVFAVTRKRVGW